VEMDLTDGSRVGPEAVGEARTMETGSEDLSDLWRIDTVDGGFSEMSGETASLCDPGEGCFLDPCEKNSDCLSGWCVEHLGAQVCTTSCQDECPPGWNCRHVAGTEPDVVYVCVSSFANLCKPCVAGADCKSIGGTDDLCVDYGPDGDFCGGACSGEQPCPFGFECQEVLTVDGFVSSECVNEADVCPCTQQAKDLQLWTACEIANELGTCGGKRVCGPAGLSLCDAPEPSLESCNGVDDDCDKFTDEGTCDDGNPCSEDTCHPSEGCKHQLLNGTECMDGNPCTAADHCVEGVCVGTPVVCNDDNPCTDDECDGAGGCLFAPNTDSCDDGNPCTLADGCKNGSCNGVEVACDCQADADCTALEDDDLCNGTLFCDTAKVPYHCAVVPTTVVECPEPTGLNASCLTAVCDSGTGECGLFSANEGQPCDDGNPCSTGDKCLAGECTGNAEINCNDGNLCTDDFCDPVVGCQHENNVQPCQDGDACTIGDGCLNGECVAGVAKSCEDFNPCSDDACDPGEGCVHVANNALCDDNNECTTTDQCTDGKCAGTGSLECDDDNPCTKDVCLPAGGCGHEDLNGAPCQDGNGCTNGDVCQQGSCQPGAVMDCDDANPCTDDSCDVGVCVHEPNEVECDDGNACTATSFCDGGNCIAGGLVSCDDDNLCTTDFCHPTTGCSTKFNENPCDDSDACTAGDACQLGTCVGAVEVVCNDGNVCTDNSCSPELGCLYQPNEANCDDKNACTLGDICADGGCLGNTPLDCNDDTICTADSCFPTQGCVHDVIIPCCGNGFVEPPEECDDGNNVNDAECLASCKLPGCDDGLLNGVETDLDCGGNCPVCADGLACELPGDCESGVCTDDVCQEPACDDEVPNGSESDQDCGGACNPCADGQDCNGPGDCTSLYCHEGECQTPACDDEIKNGAETDLDCGGDCPACLDGQGCIAPGDCVNLICADEVCQEPACDDGEQNGSETDVDCGSNCSGCAVGKACLVDSDCLGDAFCQSEVCSVYGDGEDGIIGPGSGTTTINTTASPASGTAGEMTLTVDANVQFVAGQRVLIHQTTGDEAGLWEERLLVSQDGATLTLSTALTNSYVTQGASKAQVLVMPEYQTVTLTAQTLTAAAWNGSVGGILAFAVSGKLDLQGGSINMSGRGFRGKQHGCTYRCQDGWSGESPAGDMGTGTSPAANSMGGGGGQRGQDCAAGGGGGYGTVGAKGANGSKGACHIGNHEGGNGGAAGGVVDTRTRLLFGGAGGEGGGDEDGGYPGKGGAGGGIVVIRAPEFVIANGTILLNGESGTHGIQSCGSGGGMGGGGGGAGGGAWLRADSITLGDGKITASGGGGGKCGPSNSSHPGGTGGVGRIAVQADETQGTTSPSWVESGE
jgi:hypothetical protein